ncbi:hypothetical protein PENPOL_c009G00870 [Penicillium polonicum]|uniref:NADP-dependent oxidoreductase domain-containing protein n=1 Tax=Penicillium polonicum TaxID=60169 RepID=A0A1V6NFA1_PENPO|nr:hypothetical protein PENPOL_c009G00870 [Penicillium polonicum]
MRIIPVFYVTYNHATGSGEAWAGMMGSMNNASAFKLLDAFYEAGGNFIDTANVYQNEQSEEGIDIYYVHYWDFTTSIKEVMDALHILVEQGKVLYLGASDTPAWIVAAANTYATDHGKLPLASTKDIGTFLTATLSVYHPYGPCDVLDGGKFQYKIELERRKAAGEGLRAFAGRPPHLTEEEIKVSEALEKIAGNVFPLIGGHKVEHLEGNIQALSLKLTQAQIEHLESVKPFNPGFPHNFITDPNVTSQRPEADLPMRRSMRT